MHDRQRTKKNVKFCDFDLFSNLEESKLHVLFFENPKPVIISKEDGHLLIAPADCIVEIKNNHNFSHEQKVLADLFSKGLYYKNITKYDKAPSLFLSIESVKSNPKTKTREFEKILKQALNKEIGKIEILESGEIVTYPYEPLNTEEIAETIKNGSF